MSVKIIGLGNKSLCRTEELITVQTLVCRSETDYIKLMYTVLYFIGCLFPFLEINAKKLYFKYPDCMCN